MPFRNWFTHVALVILVLAGISSAPEASPCSDWQWINPLPQGNVLLGVAYGNATWVAVGDVGTVLTTPDGANLMVRDAGTTANLDGVVWTGSQFIAVGQSILTSPDGVSWFEQMTGTDLHDVAWGNGLAVAVGLHGAILTSPDGVTWTPQVSGTTVQLFGVTWGGGLYVAVGSGDIDGGMILTSPDAVTWTRRTSGTVNALRAVAWNGIRYVAVGDHANGDNPSMLSSTDGIAWIAENPGTTRSLRDVVWTGSQFVVVGFLAVMTSPDGVAWTLQASSWVLLFSVASDPSGNLMGVGDSGQVMTSPDGVTWTDQVAEITYNDFDDVAWNGSDFVAVGRYVLHSPDGYSWSVVDTESEYGVAWSGSLWVAVGYDGRVISSPDGITWTSETSGTSEILWKITWGDAQFVVVGYNGIVLTSPDGMTWTSQTSGIGEHLYAVTWNGMLYVAVGRRGTILTSPNGVDWADRSQVTTAQLNDVCWTGTRFVAVGGGSGTVYTSEDGVTWADHSFFAASAFSEVEWNGIEVTAVTPGGAVWTSPDGTVWTEEPSPTTYQMRTMAAVGSDLWVFGNKSVILRRSEIGCDFGDAPDPSYPTLLASDGARHLIGGLYLGASVDGEIDGQPTTGSDGDDTSGVDDEDGVNLPPSLHAGAVESLDVFASQSGLLSAWVDFDGDGDWLDPGEQVFSDQPLVAGLNSLDLAVPLHATGGATVARFRFSSTGGFTPTGLALDGEVEDHSATVIPSAELELTVADDPDPVPDGEELSYFLTTINNGTIDATEVTLTHTLPVEVFFKSSEPGWPTCVEASGIVTCDFGTLPPGGSAQVTTHVKVPSGVSGVLTSSATVTLNEQDPLPSNNFALEETTVIDHVTHIFSDGFEAGNLMSWHEVTRR